MLITIHKGRLVRLKQKDNHSSMFLETLRARDLLEACPCSNGHLDDDLIDYNYQNAFRCNLCNVDLCHSRAIPHKRKNTIACRKAFW